MGRATQTVTGIIAAACVALFLVAGGVVGRPEPAVSSSSPVMRLDPEAVKLVGVPGKAFTMDVVLEGVSDLGAFAFEVGFDPLVFELHNIELGPFLGSTGRNVTCQQWEIIGDGIAAFGCNTGGPTPPGATGSGVVASLDFSLRSAADGETSLLLYSCEAADVLGAALPVNGCKGSKVSINAATGTPTRTPTGTPTKTPTDTPTDTPVETLTSTPTDTATKTPTSTWTNTPVSTPTRLPTITPISTPTGTETGTPLRAPTDTPTRTPSSTATDAPTSTPVDTPTGTPLSTPTDTPTRTPLGTPADTPTRTPTSAPTGTPTKTPSSMPTDAPTRTPSSTPMGTPTRPPPSTPADTPTGTPTSLRTTTPSAGPSPSPTEPGSPGAGVTPTSTPAVTPTSTATLVSEVLGDTPTPAATPPADLPVSGGGPAWQEHGVSLWFVLALASAALGAVLLMGTLVGRIGLTPARTMLTGERAGTYAATPALAADREGTRRLTLRIRTVNDFDSFVRLLHVVRRVAGADARAQTLQAGEAVFDVKLGDGASAVALANALNRELVPSGLGHMDSWEMDA